MQTEKLSISLPTDMALMVRRQVKEGGYASNSEVIREALRLWQQRAQSREERLAAVRDSLERAASDPQRHDAASITAHFDRLTEEAEAGRNGKTDHP